MSLNAGCSECSGPLLEQLRGALVVNAQSKLGGRGIGVKLLPLTVGR